MIGPGEPRQRRVLRHLAVVAIAAYGAAGLFTLVVTAPLLPDDSAILAVSPPGARSWPACGASTFGERSPACWCAVPPSHRR
jgi:hypothetical protein